MCRGPGGHGAADSSASAWWARSGRGGRWRWWPGPRPWPCTRTEQTGRPVNHTQSYECDANRHVSTGKCGTMTQDSDRAGPTDPVVPSTLRRGQNWVAARPVEAVAARPAVNPHVVDLWMERVASPATKQRSVGDGSQRTSTVCPYPQPDRVTKRHPHTLATHANPERPLHSVSSV